MTILVNIHEAKAQLSHLLAQAKTGEEVIICNRNVPEVRLVAIETKPKKKRKFGLARGEFVVPDSFFEPMNDDELALWYDAPFTSPDDDARK